MSIKCLTTPELLQQLALQGIDGIPLDAAKIYTEGTFSEIWILTDSRSSIQHLSNWSFIGDSTSKSILRLFQQLSDRHPIHLQWVPSHVGLLGNEVADDLAKAATSNPVDPEDHMVLTSTEIYSRAKELICRTCTHMCIASVLSVFSSIVREFLELFYNLWRTVLVKNKIVLDPAFGFNHFEPPKTQQLVSEVGLNAINKSDGGPVPDSSRKIDRQHECQYGRNEIELTGMNANMGELNTKLTNVNEQISANKEELKSDLKGIGDKLTTMDKKFEEMEGRIDGGCKPVGLPDQGLPVSCFSADAADILQTLPETQRLDIDALLMLWSYASERNCEGLQQTPAEVTAAESSETELATDVERLSHLAFSDCPTEVREVLALQHFVDGVRDPEIQKALRMADLKDLKGALCLL
ncbi:RNase H domain-containing protein [Trichonephila clavipes]|uniref:RNase H domain-containing protein n=1 Tax=Trichonephila clavipes TaxID=2585209 RepID=A0A8X6V5Z7_TRICX|nr:RNase H domain-containing protein [Trichonephila clavipes]